MKGQLREVPTECRKVHTGGGTRQKKKIPPPLPDKMGSVIVERALSVQGSAATGSSCHAEGLGRSVSACLLALAECSACACCAESRHRAELRLRALVCGASASCRPAREGSGAVHALKVPLCCCSWPCMVKCRTHFRWDQVWGGWLCRSARSACPAQRVTAGTGSHYAALLKACHSLLQCIVCNMPSLLFMPKKNGPASWW